MNVYSSKRYSDRLPWTLRATNIFNQRRDVIEMSLSVVVILGAPRSGTTLLRTLLGSHSEIAALPETPWLMGVYGEQTSVRSLRNRLINGEDGAVKNISGITPADVDLALREFLTKLFSPWLPEKGKRILVIKTPDDSLFLDQLVDLFPDAKYVHIVRDPRDVTLSTMSRFTVLNGYGKASADNCIRRWLDFEERIKTTFAHGKNYYKLKYESLVENPGATLDPVMRFLGVDIEELKIDVDGHDLPGWEEGSKDVKSSAGVIAKNVKAYEKANLTAEQRNAFNQYSSAIREYDYPECLFEVSGTERSIICIYKIIETIKSGIDRTAGNRPQ
jgi:hypothetical protein